MPVDVADGAGALADISHADVAHTHANEKHPVTANTPAYQNEHHGQKVVIGGIELPATLDEQLDNVPTLDEMEGPNALRRVSAPIPFSVYTIAFVELCERFSYYGSQVVFANFVNHGLPNGSLPGANPLTGAGGSSSGAVSGALGMGSEASAGINTFVSFWVYTTPLFGAYIADAYWGRYKTICVSLFVVLIAHIFIICSAVPAVIVHEQESLGLFIVGIIFLGIGTGGFKPNVSPLIVEQIPVKVAQITVLPTGERVIIDPTMTQSRIFHYFYMFINIGALIGQVTMVYSEKYVGFWLAYTLPTIIYMGCPAVMWWGRNRYDRTPPTGSVFGKVMKLWVFAQKGRWSINPVSTFKRLNDGTFWENVKPSQIEPSRRPRWMTFDDAFVDEARRGFAACSVFCWYPLYWLTYNQLNANLTNQASTMTLNGVPNDVLNQLDSLAVIIFIPICDLGIYPLLRKSGIRFSPIRKITAGFFTGCAAMIWAAVLQQSIYQQSPCGYDANTCEDADGNVLGAPINVWAQTGAYVLIALSEIFASITSLEYAYSKAPRSMRSFIQAVALFSTAFASAIGEALNPLSADPLLTWNYAVMAGLSGIGGVLFYLNFRSLDAIDDELDLLPEGHVFASKDEEHFDDIDDVRPVAGEITESDHVQKS